MAYAYIEDIWVGEDDPDGLFARFTVTLSEALQNGGSIEWDTSFTGSAGTADYVSSFNNVLTFAPGQLTQTIDVTLRSDVVPERVESFGLLLSNPSSDIVLARNLARAFIVDNDTGSTSPRITVDDVLLDENDGTASMVVRLDGASTSVVSVDYTTVDALAVAGSDYAATSGTLSFLPGEVVQTVAVDVGRFDDALAESSENFFFQLSGAVNGTLGQSRARITLVDNDTVRNAAVAADMRIADTWVGEGDGVARFLVTLSQPSLSEVSATWRTVFSGSAGTADYRSTFNNSLLFAPGEVSKLVSVTLTNDLVAEGLESFGVELSNVSGASVSKGSATATIVDDDAVPVGVPNFLRPGGAAVQVLENARWVEIPVALSAPSTTVMQVAYATRAITASEGADFTRTTGTLVFQPGEVTKTVRVLLPDDGAYEARESFALDFSPTGAASPALAASSVVVTIDDDEVTTFGTPRADRLNGTAGADHIYGLDGNDTIHGFGGNDLIVGGVGIDRLYGDGGADTLFGGPGGDLLQGGPGPDTMIGGSGNDIYVVESAGDRVVERAGEGIDRVVSSITTTLAANVENGVLIGAAVASMSGNAVANTLVGNGATNGLAGGGGNDILIGGGGNDLLLGGGGNDRLVGGAGRDLLSGGGGADVFQYASITDSRPGAQRDVIQDFVRGSDHINLAGIDANSQLGGNQAFAFIGATGFHGVAGELRFAAGLLQGDVNGDGVADFQVALQGVAALAASDIFL